MAEEKEIDVEESEEASDKKKLPLKLILIIVAVLLVVGGGIFGWVQFKNGDKKGQNVKGGRTTARGQQKGATSAFGNIFPLENFVVNLNDPGGKRYLKTKIELEFFQEGFEEELNVRLPQLRDVVLLILSSKTLGDIQGIDGKIALRNELIVRINQILKVGKVRNLYFTEFVIQ